MSPRQIRAASTSAVERNVGTLWTLKRGESTARCGLISMQDTLQLRVWLDGAPLRSEDCGSYALAFELGDRWRVRMMERGWLQVTPLAPSPRVL